MNVSTALNEMKAYIAGFPGHVKAALEIGEKASSSFNVQPVSAVLIAGLGGSGIGGKIISQLVWDSCGVPIVLINDYQIPNWVDSNTLFIGCSYSGNTEETLAALAGAQSRNAQIACISSGGKLTEIAEANNYNLIAIPAGQPPRTSFGYNSPQLLFILSAYGLIPGDFKNSLASIAATLTQKSAAIQQEAQEIAKRIVGKTPVIYSDVRMEGVAVRFRQQINENAKMLCWHHVLPEMNHNELVGWAGGSNDVVAIFMQTPDDHPNTQKRMELTQGIISKKTENIINFPCKGNDRVERAYYLIHLGDWVSYFLAEITQVDPIEIEVIDFLKSELAKS